VLIAKEPDFPSPAMFVRKVYDQSSNKVRIEPGKKSISILTFIVEKYIFLSV
jgi:hypothetical protein